MYFIGIISKENEYEILNNNICTDKKSIALININKNNIQNFKNVKFDTIVIMDNLEELEEKNNYIDDIYKNINYLIINSDIEIRNKILSQEKVNIITCGGNHTSTITFSSITDEMVLITVQREITNKNGKKIEVGEYNYKTTLNNNKNLYEILVEFIIKRLYCY